MEDIKLFSKNEKELETLIQTIRIYSQDIGMEFRMEKCALFIMKSEKGEATKGIKQPTQERIRTLGEKGKLQVLGNIGSGHNQTSRNERKKNKKRVS